MKACVQCGEEFQQTSNAQKFCSDTCKEAHRQEAAGKGPEPTTPNDRSEEAKRPRPARKSARRPAEGKGGRARGRTGLNVPSAPVQAKARSGGAPASTAFGSVTATIGDQGDGPLKLVVTSTCEIELTGELLAQILQAAATKVRGA